MSTIALKRYRPALKILGALLVLFGLTLIPPILVDTFYHEEMSSSFGLAFLYLVGAGSLLWLPNRHAHDQLRTRQGFLVVVMFWTVLCFAGAVPFYLSPRPDISWTDAVFESVSGITTTGATILDNIDNLPKAILYYRQQLQLLGGIGIVLLAVAILPMLGVGGMQLYLLEATGPTKDNKFTPRIAETAKMIWLIYLGMTFFCCLGYLIAGMGGFDALCYGFATVSTGGFAPHASSMGYFDSPLIKLIAIVFMFLSAMSFSLHYLAISKRKIGTYSRDPELKTFLQFIILIGFTTWVILEKHAVYSDPAEQLIDALFQTVSLCTTAGLVSAPFDQWPLFLPILLLLAGTIGGCAGSTSGGLKMLRVLILFKQSQVEIKRLVHPHAQNIIKIGRKAVSKRVIEGVVGFIAVYFFLFSILLILLTAEGNDFLTMYSAVIACLGNIGPGLGEVANSYSGLSDYGKWLLSFAMLAGRLEIFTILVIFSPAFWRH